MTTSPRKTRWMPIASSVLVGGLDQQPAAVGLEHGGVVDAQAERSRLRRVAVGIDDAHLEQRVASRHGVEDVLDAPAFGSWPR